MTTTTNAENSRQQYKSTFSLIVNQILAFTLNNDLIREVKNLSPNFKRIAYSCFTLQITLIQIDRSTLSEKFNDFCQK